MAATVNMEKCTGCGECVEECPLEAITIENDKASISDECAECGACIEVCKHDALSL